MASQQEPQYSVKELFWWCVAFAYAAFCLYPIARQSLAFLQHGVWVPAGLLDYLALFQDDPGWLTHPYRWIGLHRVLNFLNATVSIILLTVSAVHVISELKPK